MVRLHFSRVIFQAIDLYVYATRSDNEKHVWLGVDPYLAKGQV